MAETVRVTHLPSSTVIAEGPIGWGITPFEGSLYIRRKYLTTGGWRPNYFPGLCWYKFFYVGMDLYLADGTRARNVGWLYWLPNPLLPFIWYRVSVSRWHPDLLVETLPPDGDPITNRR